MSPDEPSPDSGANAPLSDGVVPATQSPTEQDAIHASPSEDALPVDFFVALTPLTLPLLARQLERMSITFTTGDEVLVARWDDGFTLTIRVVAEIYLSIRVDFVSAYPSSAIGAIESRCNWWNSSKMFLKASAGILLARVTGQSDVEPMPVAVVNLDLELPCRAGLAPVQIQALVQDVLRNVRHFQKTSALDQLRNSPGWG